MKKYFFWAASAALVLSSCSNDVEEATVASLNNREIKVTTYTPGMTRADVATNDSVKEKGFFMYAVDEDGKELINTYYEYKLDESTSKSSWKPSNDAKYEWPETAVDFYGIYDPAGSIEVANGNVSFSGLGERDVMVAKSEGLKLETNGQNVGLKFQHILADVSVSFVGTNSLYDYYVYGVSFEAPNGGSYSLSNTDFREVSEPVTFTLMKAQMNDAKEYTDSVVVSKNAEQYTQIDTTIMVVPATNVKMTISYKITIGTNPITVVKNESKTVTLNELVAGKHNTVKVKMTPSALPITVSTEVEPWDENKIESTIGATENNPATE